MARLTEKEREALHKSVREGANRKPQPKPAPKPIQQQVKIEFKGALGGSKPGEKASTTSYNNQQTLNEKRLGLGEPNVARPAESATARAMHEKRLQEPGSNQPDFLKPQAPLNIGEALRKFQAETPSQEPAQTPYEKWYNEKVGNTFIGKALGALQKADTAVSNVKAGALDTATFGLTQGLGRAVTKGTPLEELRQERTETPSYKVGEVLGYIPPGAAIERGVAKVGGKAVEKAPLVLKGALSGLATGAVEQAAQEAGDVAFRGREFNPEQIAINAGIGGAAGTILPLVAKGVQKLVNKNALGGGSKEAIQTSSGATPTVEKAKDSWYNRLFGSSNVGIKAGSKETRTGTGTQIVNNPLKNDTQGLINQARETGRAIKQNYVDATAPLKHLGGDVQDVALDARRANNIANTWIRDVSVTPEGEVIGASLKDVIGAVPRGRGNAFEDYLVVRHAKTRVARGEKVYGEKLDEYNDVKKLEDRQAELEKRYPEFKRIGNEWDAYNDRLLETGKNFGLISDAQKTKLREENPNYASMRRQFSKSEKYANAVGAKQGFSGQKAPIKEVSPTGSARQIVSPIRSAIEQTGAWMQAGFRNRVMQEIYKQVEENPEAFKGLVEIVPDHLHQKNLKEINDVLQKDGVEGLTELLNDEYNAMFVKGKGGKTDNLVTVMLDGNPVKMKVSNPEVFKALQGMSPQERSIVLGTLNVLSKGTKQSATGVLAPLFAAKGLSTDLVQGLIQAKNPLTHAGNVLHALVSSIADTLPKGTKGVEGLRSLAQDYRRGGGEYSAALRGDRALNRSVSSLKREPILSPKGIGKGTLGAVKGVLYDVPSKVSDIAENLNRIAAYKSELSRQGGERTPEAIRKAFRESQDITTNFSAKGAKSDDIESVIPYSNAAVQSIRRFGNAWRKNPIKTALATTTLVALPKLYEQYQFGDDPDYLKLPERTKFRNVILAKNPDGTFVQVPMPPEYEAIGALIAAGVNQQKNDEPIKWRDTADALVNAYTPPFLSGAAQGVTQGGGLDQSISGAINSTVVSPVASIGYNRSFTGAPLVPERLADNSPYMQKDERTSALSSWLAETGFGKAAGLSPIKLDYIAKQYGGDLARLGLPQVSAAGSGTRAQTLLRNFIVDPTFTNNLSRDFYNKIDKVTQISNDVGDGEQAPPWLTDDVKKLATSRAKGTPLKQLTELSTEKRSILGDKTLSAEVKAQKLRENQRKINQIYLDVTATLDKDGVE